MAIIGWHIFYGKFFIDIYLSNSSLAFFKSLKPFNLLTVVTQMYETHGDTEYIIQGNSGLLKCKIPSFVSDFLEVVAWIDSDGATYSTETKNFNGLLTNDRNNHRHGECGQGCMYTFRNSHIS